MSRRNTSSGPGRLRRIARLVYTEAGLEDPPVISGLYDLTREYDWRHPR